MRNYGQHNALAVRDQGGTCGALVVTMDDDLQNPPEEIPKLLAKLEKGYDVIYGTPEKETHGLWRDLASQVTKIALQSAMGVETARNVSAFACLSHLASSDAFAAYRGPFVSIDVLLTWETTRFAAVSVRHEPRQFGVSNYTFGKLVRHSLNMMTGFSTLPLQLASIVGFGFTLFGLLILAYVIGRVSGLGWKCAGVSFPGFHYCHIRGSATLCPWDYWRVCGTNPRKVRWIAQVYVIRETHSHERMSGTQRTL